MADRPNLFSYYSLLERKFLEPRGNKGKIYWGEDGRFDFSGTVQNLRKAERVLKEASLQLTTH